MNKICLKDLREPQVPTAWRIKKKLIYESLMIWIGLKNRIKIESLENKL